ncbi:16S rRNA (adenine(1518)-N(6)/adenine(1519)-N(6))-dimethyltransferase RsmA [Populibacterium corticicola]|uniref:Ribosomal RNA small subunit methyltransferase A n=1 Tax=Populibacterium corticicola TaxID=1812826 RepID=A0ABW5XLD2_9MICO
MTDSPNSLLGPAQIRELAASFGITPTKSKGQNFLHDAGTVRKIVRTSGVVPGERVVEVGPGLGSLTLGLLEAGCSVIAVELDTELAPHLKATAERFVPGSAERLDVVQGDALEVTELPGEQPTAFVANLPYNVSVPILLTFLERFESLEKILVMVQLEVAERIVATPGSKIYGVPSAKAAWYASASKAMRVGRNVFWPAPNVDSALVYLERRPAPETTAPKRFVFRVVDAAFAQRRKTLRQALSGIAGSAAQAAIAIEAAGLDSSARGETLNINDFARIAEQLLALGIPTEPSPRS